VDVVQVLPDGGHFRRLASGGEQRGGQGVDVPLGGQHVPAGWQADGGRVRGIGVAGGDAAARRTGRRQRQAGEVAAAGLAGLPGAGAAVPAPAVRAGVGEQDLAAGAGEGPRYPPGEHPPAAIGGQAARAVPGSDQLPPPAGSPRQAGRGGDLGQAGALIPGQRHAGEGLGGDPGDGAERGQVGLVQLVEPQLVRALAVAGQTVPVRPGEGEDVADGDVQQAGVGFQPAVERLAGQRGQADRDGRHERPSAGRRQDSRPGGA
jgi:hypothetical protein